jgi:SH3-like domain-containing protein
MRSTTFFQRLRQATLITTLTAFAAASLAAEYVSVKREAVNMRSGPGTNHAPMWRLPKDYPLRVQQHRGRWLKVIDVEKDTGWVYAPMTTKKPHHIVKSETANVRSGPGTNYHKVGQASFGEIVAPIAHRDGWIKVRRTEGPSGWISRKLLWGW